MNRVRKAVPAEADSISSLALRSKAYWDYSHEELAVFRGELTIDAEKVVPHRMHVLEEQGEIVGFYSLAPHAGNAVELEHLFVEPKSIGQGLGSLLFKHACHIAGDAGFARLVIQSDPNAAGFYLAVGAKLERRIPSSIPGRTIPYFAFTLSKSRED